MTKPLTSDNKRAILFAIVYTLTAIALLLGIYAVYNLIAVQKPWTIGTTFMSRLNYSENKESIFSIKVNSNKNKNGQPIYDFQLSSYNDANAKSVSSYGIQCVGNWKYLNKAGYTNQEPTYFTSLENLINFNFSSKSYKDTAVQGNFYFYKSDDGGLTYYKINYDEIPTFLLIDIDGASYKASLKNYTYTTEHNYKWYKFWRWGQTYEIEHTTQFTWFEVFDKIMFSANYTSAETEFSRTGLNSFELSDFLEISYKDDKGQYHPVEETTETRNLFAIPVDFTLNGATEAKDSKFKMVKNSPTWSHWNDTSVVDYWGVDEPQTITENELNYIHYTAYDGYFLTLDAKFENYLKTAKTDEINIVIDLANKTKYPLKGIDLKNFGFKINSFTILNASEDFIILNQEKCDMVPTLKSIQNTEVA